jgi:hypothetical protein
MAQPHPDGVLPVLFTMPPGYYGIAYDINTAPTTAWLGAKPCSFVFSHSLSGTLFSTPSILTIGVPILPLLQRIGLWTNKPSIKARHGLGRTKNDHIANLAVCDLTTKIQLGGFYSPGLAGPAPHWAHQLVHRLM